MAFLEQEGLTEEQKGVVLRLRTYGANIKGNRIVQAVLFETMTKASAIFPQSTATNIQTRDIHAMTIMWELKQDHTRFRHLCPLGQGLVELVPAFMKPAPVDCWIDADGNNRIGKGTKFEQLRNGQGVPADQFTKNEVAVRVEQRLGFGLRQAMQAGILSDTEARELLRIEIQQQGGIASVIAGDMQNALKQEIDHRIFKGRNR